MRIDGSQVNCTLPPNASGTTSNLGFAYIPAVQTDLGASEHTPRDGHAAPPRRSRTAIRRAAIARAHADKTANKPGNDGRPARSGHARRHSRDDRATTTRAAGTKSDATARTADPDQADTATSTSARPTTGVPQRPTRRVSQRPSRRRHGWLPRPATPRIAAELLTAALHLFDPTDTATTAAAGGTTACTAPTSQTGETTPVDLDAANLTAGHLARIHNAARMANTATSRRGQLAAWRTVLDLPDDFHTAKEQLDHYATQLADEITTARQDLITAANHLNRTQTAPGSWSLPIDPDTPRGTWAGRDHWITCATAACNTARTHKRLQASAATTEALIRARADYLDPAGHNGTAAAATIVTRAIERHGATITPATGARYLRAITTILATAGLLIIHARGRHLDTVERFAAHAWHGHVQKAAGNVVDATLPNHLRPTSPAPATRPAWAHGLTDRLATRDNHDHTAPKPPETGTPENTPADPTGDPNHGHTTTPAATSRNGKSSTYTCGYGLSCSLGSHRVAHPRARAREHHPTPTGHTEPDHRATRGDLTPASGGAQTQQNAPAKAPKTAPSLRAWRIADDLTRVVDGCGAANGPYARLVGPEKNQASLTHLARLIDTHTPCWATTRDVMRAIAHAATSQTTGHIALGLPRHRAELPHNPTGWLTSVFTRLDFTNPEQFPTWSRTADAFGVTWNGARHHWTPIG